MTDIYDAGLEMDLGDVALVVPGGGGSGAVDSVNGKTGVVVLGFDDLATTPFVTPEMYGAKGDGVTNDKAAIESMLSQIPENSLVVMNGDYYISGGITITRPVNIQMYGKFIVAPDAEFGVRISGHNVRRNTFRLNLETSSATGHWNGTYNTIGVDLLGSWENSYDISVRNFTVGIRLMSTNIDCTYNKVFIRYIFDCKTAILLTGDETLIGGTTAQNTFFGGRVGASQGIMTALDENDPDDCYYPLNSVLVGSRTNNNNNFFSVSFECGFETNVENYEDRAVIFADMNYCVFSGCRFEGLTSFRSNWFCSVISGFGFDSLNYTGTTKTNGTYKPGKGTAIGVNAAQITSYTKPVRFQRTGDQNGDAAELYNANGYKVGTLGADGTPIMPSFKLTNSARVLDNAGASTAVLFRDITPPSKGSYTEADYVLSSAFAWLSNNTWGFSNYGFLAHKDTKGNVQVVQPIYTAQPTNPRLGTMALVDGKPMWYNGTEWVYANGETSISSGLPSAEGESF